jgi:transcriptional regulator with XRE-family HTH domain
MSKQNELDRAAGAALRALREKAGRSQEDLSIEIDMDQSTLSKVERLGPSAVGWTRFCKIAEALGHQIEIVFHPAQQQEATSQAGPAVGRQR